jgi:hypothetical protein
MTRKKKTRTKPPASSEQLTTAENELRRAAAEWCAVIRNRIMVLSQEVAAVSGAAAPGSLLARVFDVGALSAVHCALYDADCHAGNLNITGEDPRRVPDLLGMAKQLAGK